MVELIIVNRKGILLIDEEDAEVCMQFRWYLLKSLRTDYAFTRVPGNRTPITAHRFLMPEAVEVDHRNGNGLDCRRQNLRDSTHKQNCRNRKSFLNSSSSYLGVTWVCKRNKWQAQSKVDGKNVFLGYFDDEQDAALAYDVFVIEHFGEFARPNFERELVHG